MTRIMRDSTKAADVPNVGTDIAAGYVNGTFAWTTAEFNHFPVHATIDVNGTHIEADILDVEAGDASVATAVHWVKTKHIAHPHIHYPPIIYCNRATLMPLFNAMVAAGLHVGKDFRLWIATLDGTKTVADMTGVTAVQYAGQLQTKHHYDESIVYDNAWKTKSPPPTKTALLVQGDFTSRLVRSTDGVTWR
jgi:hypothetical protein